ncbi:MAG: DMT family transporter [Candidatus Kapabacteria bacterium]|nr:DMT family transporter [Candidatus Kapabacteria bacterium]
MIGKIWHALISPLSRIDFIGNTRSFAPMLLGLLAASTTLVSWSFGTLSFLKASRLMDPGLLNRARLGLAVMATITIACIATGMMPWTLLGSTTSGSWLWLGLSGFIGLTVGDLFGFTSLRILGARRQSVIGTTAPVASALFGFALLGEQMTLTDAAGMMLSIGGVMYAMNSDKERQEVATEGFGSYTLGILLAIGGAACQGAGLVLAKLGMTGQNAAITPFHATFLRMIVGFGATYVVDVLRRAPHRPLKDAFAKPEARSAMLMGTVFGPVIGVTMSLVAARNLDVAVAQTIMSMVPFVVMAIMRIGYSQPVPFRSLVGAIISVAGVILLITGSQ